MNSKHYCYEVSIGSCVLAQYMELDTATTLAKALFEKYSDEPTMEVKISKVAIKGNKYPFGIPEEINNGCHNCKYKDLGFTDEPCLNCGVQSEFWEPDESKIE